MLIPLEVAPDETLELDPDIPLSLHALGLMATVGEILLVFIPVTDCDDELGVLLSIISYTLLITQISISWSNHETHFDSRV